MTVLAAVNETRQGQLALQTAAHEATLRDSSLIVLDLTPESEAATRPSVAIDVGQLPGALHDSPISFRKDDVEPGDAILAEAQRVGADLIVIGAKPRHSSVGSFLLGSTTAQVLLDADAEVLVVKVPKEETSNQGADDASSQSNVANATRAATR